jgi:hypothetical protein
MNREFHGRGSRRTGHSNIYSRLRRSVVVDFNNRDVAAVVLSRKHDGARSRRQYRNHIRVKIVVPVLVEGTRFYLRFPIGVTLPGTAWPGFCMLRSASMKMNWSGGAAQVNCVLCAALLTRIIFSSNSVPNPDSGTKSFE